MKTFCRKIWIGTDPKINCMTYEVGRDYSIGRQGSMTIDHITVEDDVFKIYGLKDNNMILWKEGNMPFMIERPTDYK